MYKKFILFIVMALPLWSYSAIVVKIKNNKAFVHLEGEEAVPGDLYKALDLYGKPQGILRIGKVRNGKAIATIVEGRAGINWILEKTVQSSLGGSGSSNVSSNMVGVLGGGYLYVGSKEKGQTIIRGFAGDTSVFVERFFTPHFSTRILLGMSYSQLNQSCRSNSRNCVDEDSTLSKLSAPNVALTFFLNTNIANHVKAFFGLGANFSVWHNLNHNTEIIKLSNFGKIQSAAHLSLGLNLQMKSPQIHIPISLTYTRTQFGSKFYQKHIQGRSPSEDLASWGYFALQVGVATEF